MSILSPTTHAVSDVKSYDMLFMIAGIGLNLPYTVQLLSSKKGDLKNRLCYQGDTQAAIWNHSLNLVNVAALSTELPAKYLFLTSTILVGLQTSTYVFCQSTGVSLVWSSLTGMLLYRLCIEKVFKWHLLLTLLLNSATLVYYGYKGSTITNIAHLGGIATGFSFSFLLPYHKNQIQKNDSQNRSQLD